MPGWLKFPAIFLVLTAWTFLIMRDVRVPVVDGDHQSFLGEKTHYADRADYFVAILSFNRTRHTAQGDGYLFRPGFTGWLAWQDLLVGDSPSAILTWNKFQHAATGFSLFCVIYALAGNAWAWWLSLLFLAHSPSAKLVACVHLAPYMGAIFFLGWAILALLKERPALSAVAFFLSATFHEVTALALIPLALLAFRSGKRNWAIACLLPALAFLSIDLISYLSYGTALLTERDQPMTFLRALSVVYHYPLVIGQYFVPLLVPQCLVLPTTLKYVIFLPIGLIILWLSARFVRGWKKGPPKTPPDFSALTSVFSLLVLALGVTYGRGALRGLYYVNLTYWNNYLSHYLWLIVGAYFLSSPTISRQMLTRVIVIGGALSMNHLLHMRLP